MPFILAPAAVGGGGANVNLDNTYEPLGWTSASGLATLVANGASSGSKTTTPVPLGTTANAWAGFYLTAIGLTAAGSTNRFQIDILFNGVLVVDALHVEPANNRSIAAFRIPVKCAAGTAITAQVRGSAGSISIQLGLVGIIRNSNSAPGFSSMVALNVDKSTSVKASTTPTSFTSTDPPAFTSQVVTSAAYKGLFVAYGLNSTSVALATAQMVRTMIAMDAAGGTTYVEVSRNALFVAASTYPLSGAVGHMIEKVIPSGARLGTAIVAAAPGSDSINVGLYGLIE